MSDNPDETFIGPYGVPCTLKTTEVTVSITNEIAHALDEADKGNMEPLRAIKEAVRRRLSELMLRSMGYEIVEPPDPPLHPEWSPTDREIL